MGYMGSIRLWARALAFIGLEACLRLRVSRGIVSGACRPSTPETLNHVMNGLGLMPCGSG